MKYFADSQAGSDEVSQTVRVVSVGVVACGGGRVPATHLRSALAPLESSIRESRQCSLRFERHPCLCW